MKRIARLIGLFSTFLLLFMAAIVVTQHSLRKQTAQLREETLINRHAQLVAMLDLARPGPPPWSESTHETLQAALDAQIRWGSSDAAATPSADSWSFVHVIDSAHVLEVSLTPPPTVRLITTFQRTAAALLTLALCLLLLFGTFLFWNLRTAVPVEDSHATDSANVRAGLQSLQHLASVSVRQGAELEHERTERLRVDEDLHIKQLLLNRALEQKIRLGQDLHDGIIQSLYATGLTLEATRALVATDPTLAAARIADSTKALNTTIREVRAYINGLSPETLRRQTFAEAVHVLARDLTADRHVTFDLAIEEDLATSLPEETSTDLLQVVREAMSNSLRHGGATRLDISLQTDAGRPRLRIADNGDGFTTNQRDTSGRGLENIEARIRRHGGTVSIESTPGQGTTVSCLLPSPAIPAA